MTGAVQHPVAFLRRYRGLVANPLIIRNRIIHPRRPAAPWSSLSVGYSEAGPWERNWRRQTAALAALERRRSRILEDIKWALGPWLRFSKKSRSWSPSS